MTEIRPDCRSGIVEDYTVSIVIKALNEANGIAATIESALHALSGIKGEVILADSCSTDSTVEIATAYPIRIVQLSNASERCCGAGPQLGYQHSFGKYVYILDGDMKILEGFLEEAIAVMESRPEVAGVGGRVVELNSESLEYVSRERRAAAESHREAGSVDRLDGGGLYRRSAIEAAGYFSDRNLHSYEEYDLGVRLRSLGWVLWRIRRNAITHFGHDMPPYRLLVRRWRSRYACGLGELIRAAWGQPRLPMLLSGLRELRIYIAVLAWWLVLASVCLVPIPVIWRFVFFLVVLGIPVLLMSWRKRSLVAGTYAIASLCVNSAGLIRGFIAPRQHPLDKLSSRVLKDSVSNPA